MTKQEQYNEVLKKINVADEYFQLRYKTDTPDRQVKAVERFQALVKEAEKLYFELRPYSSTPELQYGFNPDEILTIQIDIEEEIHAVLERLDIIRADKWKIDQMEYLRDSKKLLVCMIRSEAA